MTLVATFGVIIVASRARWDSGIIRPSLDLNESLTVTLIALVMTAFVTKAVVAVVSLTKKTLLLKIQYVTITIHVADTAAVV